jgi:hypothetical protein
MKRIIAPIDRKLIEKELKEELFVRTTNFGDNEIYIINAHNSPNTMQEIGRLREHAFRNAGGGTGMEIDIDEFDTNKTSYYEQLIVWNPLEKEIVGGYRFINCKNIQFDHSGLPHIATAELFHFSDRFLTEFLPNTIELGRSFVQTDYQPLVNSRKGFFSLDNLWDGLGALVIDHPDIKYFFGKVTMYPQFNIKARDMILFFLSKYFPDKDNLVIPIIPLNILTDIQELKEIFNGESYIADYKILSRTLRNNYNENIPPLVNAYMNLTSTMKNFGTAINPGFGSVQETGILVTIGDIYESKKKRHLSSYKKQ